MARLIPPLDAAEARALIEQTLAWLEAPHPEAEALPHAEVRRLFRLGVASLRFGLIAAVLAEDASLDECIERAAAVLDGWLGDGNDPHEDLDSALRLAVARAPVELLAERHATHPDPDVRVALAERLNPNVPAHHALLGRLASDPAPAVRGAARRALGPRETPWWEGKLSRDPFVDLDPADIDRVAPALATLSSLLDLETYELSTKEATLAEALSALPDAVVLDIAERMGGAGDRLSRVHAIPREVLRRAGGVDLVVRSLAGERQADWSSGLSRMLRKTDEAEGTVLALALLRRAVAEQPAGAETDTPVARHLALIVARAFRPEWEGDRLLDALLDAGETFPQYSEAQGFLLHALGRTRLSAEAAERVLAALAEGFAGPWSHLGRTALAAVQNMPRPALRELVARELAGPREALHPWAAALALGKARDPDLDPPPLAHREALMALPAVRKAAFERGDLAVPMLPAARIMLRTGQLDLREATHTLKTCGSVYGGLTPDLAAALGRVAAEHRIRDRATADAAGVTDDSWAPVGPPTAEEWAAYRDLLGRALAGGAAPLERLYPEGPLCEEDRARARARIDEAMAGADDPSVLVELVALAGGSHLPGDLRALEELASREPLSRIRAGWIEPVLSAARARLSQG